MAKRPEQFTLLVAVWVCDIVLSDKVTDHYYLPVRANLQDTRATDSEGDMFLVLKALIPQWEEAEAKGNAKAIPNVGERFEAFVQRHLGRSGRKQQAIFAAVQEPKVG
ncbi:hypothetical protein AYL99_11002 [Fonsecaea erecta]|uniref:Uncharacterized protein n=1 Tax=Fonsecaea erecta TaxID=1367422 RepID=A0A178Z487_9EURO|nr:hypothetical protein AYL99_11002 [Fonsecaea erecta]OAP54554.1 hypothetical protein AYL99_11002 [Fonsecaea erecta]